MNFKILTLPKPEIQICLHRDRNDENREIVRITAFLIDSLGQELMLETVAQFADTGSARRFVFDFSIESGRIFLEECLNEDGIVIIG